MMRSTRRLTALTATTMTLCLLSTACGGGGDGEAVQKSGELAVDGEVIASAELMNAAQEEKAVNVYTSLNEVSNDKVAEAFEKDTGLTVEGIRAPTGRLMERIQSEAGSGALPADVITMPDDSLFQILVKKNLFTKHAVPADKAIPEEYKSPDGLYYALISSPTVIAYNSKAIPTDQAPKAWADLPKAGAAGHKIGMVHASQGAGGWGLALFTRKKFGKDYWQRLAATKPRLESSVGALAEKLGRGEVAVIAGRPPEIGELKEQGAPVDFVWPEDGTPMFNFFIGRVAKGKHPNAAQVYLNWSMSKRGQSVLATEGGDYPVHPQAAKPRVQGKELPAFDSVRPALPKTEDWLGLRNSWIAEWNTVFGYRS
ncbi:MAG: extracellular solute-binding protein [Streptosporangiales bacterium]|nr:extracellular solute-binding protein [Streptosporangiales bacterium]